MLMLSLPLLVKKKSHGADDTAGRWNRSRIAAPQHLHLWTQLRLWATDNMSKSEKTQKMRRSNNTNTAAVKLDECSSRILRDRCVQLRLQSGNRLRFSYRLRRLGSAGGMSQQCIDFVLSEPNELGRNREGLKLRIPRRDTKRETKLLLCEWATEMLRDTEFQQICF